MEPKMAAKAAQSVHARIAIPMHFGTSPGITQDARGFEADVKKFGIQFLEMKPGQTISFNNNQLIQPK
jgi:L-ascorbate metabolism protein UlaG (beta-lactamase superfamily)